MIFRSGTPMTSTAVHYLAQAIAAGLPTDTRTAESTINSAVGAIFAERYRSQAKWALRMVLTDREQAVPFAGLIHPDSPSSGPYGGTSLVWFPIAADDAGPAQSLITFVCGTRGLSPDESILGRPGHARLLRALSRHLSDTTGISMWTKKDPTNLAQKLPDIVQSQWGRFDAVSKRYGQFIYAAALVPHDDAAKACAVVSGFLDVYARERSWTPRAEAAQEIATLQNRLRANLLPRTDAQRVADLLRERRFVILQGPPGTGKTRMADAILRTHFRGRGMTVQFHPAVTYESFIAGIGPDVSKSELRFKVRPGLLMDAVQEAQSGEFLLVIDEINRADLSRVLGEAIHLFEAREISAGQSRTVRLPHRTDDGRETLSIPTNLFVLGTMNSADRSIAILDLAVRRRFAFVDLWPDLSVIEAQPLPLALEAFGKLQDIFSQYAAEDAMPLMPGHAYFLAANAAQLGRRLRTELIPLLAEYLQEGRLGPCESELQAYVSWLDGVLPRHG